MCNTVSFRKRKVIPNSSIRTIVVIVISVCGWQSLGSSVEVVGVEYVQMTDGNHVLLGGEL